MRILLVEDDPTTSKSIEMMLQNANLNVYATDLGEEGIDLAKLYDYDLILLDLNLPRKNGHELLREIKASESLKHIPVIVLTTSRSDEDLLRSYRLSANAVVAKPVGLDDFFHVVNLIEQFWLGTAMLSRP